MTHVIHPNKESGNWNKQAPEQIQTQRRDLTKKRLTKHQPF